MVPRTGRVRPRRERRRKGGGHSRKKIKSFDPFARAIDKERSGAHLKKKRGGEVGFDRAPRKEELDIQNERKKRYVQEDGSVREEDLLDPSPAAILRRLGLGGAAGALFIGGTEKVEEKESSGLEEADKDGIIQDVHSGDEEAEKMRKKKKKERDEKEKGRLKGGSSALRSSVVRTKRREYLQKRDIRRGKRGNVSESVLEQKVREEMENRLTSRKKRRKTGSGGGETSGVGAEEDDLKMRESQSDIKSKKGKKGDTDSDIPMKSDPIAFGEQAYRPPTFSDKSIKFLEKAKEKMKLEQQSARSSVINQYRLMKQKKMHQ